jgi:hypothetical protein
MHQRIRHMLSYPLSVITIYHPDPLDVCVSQLLMQAAAGGPPGPPVRVLHIRMVLIALKRGVNRVLLRRCRDLQRSPVRSEAEVAYPAMEGTEGGVYKI